MEDTCLSCKDMHKYVHDLLFDNYEFHNDLDAKCYFCGFNDWKNYN